MIDESRVTDYEPRSGVTGYAHPGYVRALSQFGTPRELPRCGGWLLERAIPGTDRKDAMGCYPLFACRDWSQLKADLDELAGDLVSVSLVADPFGDFSVDQLHACFPDRMIPFKQHYVLDLHQPIEGIVRKRTCRYAKAALRQMNVEICPMPLDHLDDWMTMYGCLIAKYDLKGIHVFSRESFAGQMVVPGFVMFRAFHGHETLGMLSWFVHCDVAYAHLIGVGPLGYRMRAAYALYWVSAQYFAQTLHWLNLTGVPGTNDNDTSGLGQFKRGWASGTRTAYFCGRVFQREAYEEIVRAKGISTNNYFPAYRVGEFA